MAFFDSTICFRHMAKLPMRVRQTATLYSLHNAIGSVMLSSNVASNRLMGIEITNYLDQAWLLLRFVDGV